MTFVRNKLAHCLLPLVTRLPKRVVAVFVARRETQTHFQRLHRDLSQYYRFSLSLLFSRILSLKIMQEIKFCVLEGDFVNKHKRTNGIMQISTRIFRFCRGVDGPRLEFVR